MIKTRRMQEIEQRWGRPIEVILADLYLGQNLGVTEVGERLGIHFSLVPRYLRLCGLPVRPQGKNIARPDTRKRGNLHG